MRWRILPAALGMLLGAIPHSALAAEPQAIQEIQAAEPCLPACCDCAPADCSRCWFNAEYLLWWTKSQPLPVPTRNGGTVDSTLP